MKPYYERYWKKRHGCNDFLHKWPILSQLVPKGGVSLFEFGCGKGTLLEPIAKQNSKLKIYGADVSKTAIGHIKKKIPNGKFVVVRENAKIPFASNSFDFVLCSDVMEHVYDTEFIFSELARVLKKGGHMFISVPYHGQIKNILYTLIAFDAYFEPRQPHIRFYTRKNLEKELQMINMQILKFGYYGRIYPLSYGMYAYCRK